MYLNTYNYFKYFCYNEMVKSNEPLIIKSVRSAMHSLSTPLVHTTIAFAKIRQTRSIKRNYQVCSIDTKQRRANVLESYIYACINRWFMSSLNR